MYKRKNKMSRSLIERKIGAVQIHYGMDSPKPLYELLTAIGVMTRTDDGCYVIPEQVEVKIKHLFFNKRFFKESTREEKRG